MKPKIYKYSIVNLRIFVKIIAILVNKQNTFTIKDNLSIHLNFILGSNISFVDMYLIWI